MEKSITYIDAVVSAVVAYILAKLGILAPWWGMFLLLSAFDILTGYTAAWIKKENRSCLFRLGIFRKLANIGIVLIAGVIDWIVLSTAPILGFTSIPLKGYVTLFALVFFILYELISILENLKKTGGTVPEFITAIITMLRKLFTKATSTADAGKEKQ